MKKDKALTKKYENRRNSKQSKKQQSVKFNTTTILIWVALSALTLLAFYTCFDNDFTNWDDPSLITENLLIRHFNSGSVVRIFSEPYFSNYQPLHILSYLVEYHFWGLNPSGYHILSVIQHLINVILVWIIANKFSNNITVATFTALLFAVSPMRVESVAWAAERKDMLYTQFFLLAWIFYIKYVSGLVTAETENSKNLKPLILVFIFFVLSVFSKTMAVSFVPVMVFTDLYLKRKISSKVVVEKIPFVILALIMGVISVSIASKSGAVDTSGNYEFWHRIFFGCRNLLLYAVKSIYPFNLSGYYQYPTIENNLPPLIYLVSGGVVLLLAGLIIYSYKKYPLFFFSSAFFISTVGLVLMIFPVGPTLFSERYSYLPSIMLYYFLVASAVQFADANRIKYGFIKPMLLAFLVAYAFYFIYLTRERCEIWQNSISFWTDVIEKDQKIPIAYNNRGNEYKNAGQMDEAIADYMQALKLKVDYLEPNASLGDVYRNLGKYDSAFYYLENALKLKPDYPQALINRGIVYAVANKPDSAMTDFNRAIELNPNMLEAFSNRGNLFCMQGNFDKGYEDYTRVIQLNPDFKDAYINRGRVFYQKQMYDDAIADFNGYLARGGNEPDAYLMIGRCYAAKNDFANAVSYGNQAAALGHTQASAFVTQWQNP